MKSRAINSDDSIHIEQLELRARIGVPAKERETAQRLTLSLTLWPAIGFHEMEDQLARTIDYAEVCRTVKKFVANRTGLLVETLANEIATHLLETFSLQKVRLELRKFILPDVKYVTVVLCREKSAKRNRKAEEKTSPKAT